MIKFVTVADVHTVLHKMICEMSLQYSLTVHGLRKENSPKILTFPPNLLPHPTEEKKRPCREIPIYPQRVLYPMHFHVMPSGRAEPWLPVTAGACERRAFVLGSICPGECRARKARAQLGRVGVPVAPASRTQPVVICPADLEILRHLFNFVLMKTIL